MSSEIIQTGPETKLVDLGALCAENDRIAGLHRATMAEDEFSAMQRVRAARSILEATFEKFQRLGVTIGVKQGRGLMYVTPAKLVFRHPKLKTMEVSGGFIPE